MIVVNQDRTFVLETRDLWRDKNSIYCNNHTPNEFNIKLATYEREDDAAYVFGDVVAHFTDKEPYYLPKDKSQVEISYAEEIRFREKLVSVMNKIIEQL